MSPLRLSLLLTLGLLLSLGAADVSLRPPSIPLFTSSPYMQTFMPSDNLTGSAVQYWDGDARQMRVIVRVDGKAYSVRDRGEAAGGRGGRAVGKEGGSEEGKRKGEERKEKGGTKRKERERKERSAGMCVCLSLSVCVCVCLCV